MIVVADTSPLTNLLQIGQLELLRALFNEIAVPRSVANELADARSPRPLDLDAVPWIDVRDPSDEPPPDLSDVLDSGERDASVRNCIDELRSRTGFWVAEDLVQQILTAAGE